MVEACIRIMFARKPGLTNITKGNCKYPILYRPMNKVIRLNEKLIPYLRMKISLLIHHVARHEARMTYKYFVHAYVHAYATIETTILKTGPAGPTGSTGKNGPV